MEKKLYNNNNNDINNNNVAYNASILIEFLSDFVVSAPTPLFQ